MENELFDEKYSLYSNLIFKLSMTYLGNKSDAEDITQDVFVKIFSNPNKFESAEHERYWIIRVTVNMCKNKLTSFWNKNILPIEKAENILQYRNDSDVTEMLFNLNSKYRIVLYLYYYEGYSIDEISEILKIGKSAVKMRLKRGKEKLKLDLEGDNYGQERPYPCSR